MNFKNNPEVARFVYDALDRWTRWHEAKGTVSDIIYKIELIEKQNPRALESKSLKHQDYTITKHDGLKLTLTKTPKYSIVLHEKDSNKLTLKISR